jgi:oligopeptide transport system ATP-binding protein
MSAAPLLQVRDLVKDYALPGWRPAWLGGQGAVRRVLHAISFDIAAGETLGLVGESGSGKSTTGRAILGLTRASGGSVTLAGRAITGLPERRLRPLRREMQMVFQDPAASLHTQMTIGAILDETLAANHPALTRAERGARIAALIERIGLPPEALGRAPGQFSGGQLQRIAIARALSVEPRLIVADEPVSALDTSVQAQVLNLLRAMQAERGLAMLFIAHDLAVVRQMSQRIAVMYRGHIVELAESGDLVRGPAHPYTRGLLAAIPRSHPAQPRAAVAPAQDGATAAGTGCPYAAQCPMARPLCREQAPRLRQVAPGHQAACHLA